MPKEKYLESIMKNQALNNHKSLKNINELQGFHQTNDKNKD